MPSLPPVVATFLGSAGVEPLPHGGRAYRWPRHHLVGLPPSSGRLDPSWRHVAPEPPLALRQVWSVHDGLGRPGDARTPVLSPCLLPAARVRPLSAEVRFGEHDILFAPAAWLGVVDLGTTLWCMNASGHAAPFDRGTRQLGAPREGEAMWRALIVSWTPA